MVAPSIAATGEFVTGTSATASTHAFGKPTGVVVGSMLVALYTVEHNGSGTQLAAPSGWAAPPGTPAFQSIANGTALYVWWKYADATDADSGTTEYLMPVQNGRWVRGGVMRLTDHAAMNPWEAGDGEVAASSNDVPSTTVTTTGVDRLLIWGASSYNLSTWATMPAGFTELAAFASASGETTTAAVRTVATATTVTTGAIATGASAGKAGWLGAVKPADGTATVSGTASANLGALSVAAVAGPQLRTGAVAVNPGGVSITATGLRTTSGTASVALPAVSVVANPIVRGTASVSLGALSVAATGELVFPPPGQVFDLSQWHLTLPTEDPGPDTDAAQIDQPELETYSDDHFYTDDDGMMVFVAPVTGATTSSAAGGTRSELRQHLRGSYAEAAIDPNTTGRFQLTVTTHADATNISGGTNPRKEAIIGQIHGAGDSPIPLILSAEYHVATPRVRVFKNGPSDPVKPNAVTGITPTTPITYRIRIENARLKMWVVIGQRTDLPPISTAAHYDWPVSDFDDQLEWYFKGGIYNKTPISSGSTGESVARISFIEVLEPSDPDPTGVVFGTASVSGGELNVAAAGYRLMRGTVSAPLGALSVAATGTVVAEVVTGTAAVALPAPTIAAVGARIVTGAASADLGALSVLAVGAQTVTGTASLSLGQLSVTAVGLVVAEVVTGSASVALGGLATTAVGSRVTTGAAAVTLPALSVVALGDAQHPQISAGTPTPVPGLYAGTPTPAARPYAGTPTPVTGPTAGTPIAR